MFAALNFSLCEPCSPFNLCEPCSPLLLFVLLLLIVLINAAVGACLLLCLLLALSVTLREQRSPVCASLARQSVLALLADVVVVHFYNHRRIYCFRLHNLLFMLVVLCLFWADVLQGDDIEVLQGDRGPAAAYLNFSLCSPCSPLL